MYKFGTTSMERLTTTEMVVQYIMLKAIKRSPIDFGIPEFGGRRTEEEQHALFLKGVSKCDGVKRKSVHQDGMAIDIYAYVNGKATWDPRYILVLAGVIISTAMEEGYAVTWGGDFDGDLNWDEGDSWDKGHFEFRKVI